MKLINHKYSNLQVQISFLIRFKLRCHLDHLKAINLHQIYLLFTYLVFINKKNMNMLYIHIYF